MRTTSTRGRQNFLHETPVTVHNTEGNCLRSLCSRRGCNARSSTPLQFRDLTRAPASPHKKKTEVIGRGGGLTALSPSCMDVNLKSGFFFLSRSLQAVFLNCPSDCQQRGGFKASVEIAMIRRPRSFAMLTNEEKCFHDEKRSGRRRIRRRSRESHHAPIFTHNVRRHVLCARTRNKAFTPRRQNKHGSHCY